jgi:2-polyprenyl-6-methoxyphenol hydroxylase-like FAD-dependent oxidoreductase
MHHPPPEVSRPDVFVSGGGPAGLACAIAAAQRGLSVEVADGMTPPIDKACGEGLMPDTIAALDHLGIDISTAPSAPFSGIRFLANRSSSEPIVAQANFPGQPGRGTRRPILHQLLVDRANALGVQLHWQTVVRAIDPTQSIVHTNRHTIQPRFIIGADGHQSRVRAVASLDRGLTTARRIGLRQHFNIARCSMPTTHVDVHWSSSAQAYVTPVSPNEICIAFVSRRKFSSVTEALSNFPQLRETLRHATPIGQPRGSITQSRKLHRVTRHNIALIGDASGSVDAITGEGLGLCFRQALALGDALHAADLSRYQQAHSSLRRLPSTMAHALLVLDVYPALRNRTLRLFERYPQLFQQLLGLHVGQTPAHFGLLSFGARLLAR